eukprot:TRINITY_DN411_c0_g1_i3.p1 TRINITY_DN411_c0_g1~~TRINITY_DN411_c0_g1_i3.p1  ORF type:complete len:338 (-),score=65.85 TRINITY_DN411_c0_g1_i3:94-1107(-)
MEGVGNIPVLAKKFTETIEQLLVEAREEFLKDTEKLKREREEFEREKEEWSHLSEKFSKSIPNSIIKLNVGGQIFCTSHETLTFYKGSFFDGLLSGRFPLKKEEDGTIFIDRDPTHFRHILNFLRGSLPPIDELKKDILPELRIEADFYQLSELANQLSPYPTRALPSSEPELWKWKEGPNYVVSNNGYTITKTRADGPQFSVTALAQKSIEVSKRGKYSWRVKIENGSNMMIGVSNSALNQFIINNHNFGTGWYFYTRDSSIYHQGNTSTPYPNSGILSVGTVVGVILDLDKRELSFSVNGLVKGVAVRDFPLDKFPTLTLSCSFYEPNSSLTIVE